MNPLLLLMLFLAQALAAPLAGSREDTLAHRNVYVVGLDHDGNSLVTPLPAALYRDSVRGSFSAVRDALGPALARREAPGQAGWGLRTIGVGIGFGAQVGLGPLWSVSGTARLKLVFTNSRNPVYPD